MTESTQEKVSMVKNLVDQGVGVVEACNRVGLAKSVYYKNAKLVPTPKRKNTRKAPPETANYERIEIKNEKPAMLIVGSPEQIAEVMRKYHG